MNEISVSNRFINEKIGIHWQVDPSERSFARLLEHIQVKHNFIMGFVKPLVIF